MADLPKLVVADGGGAHEAFEARTVGAEDNGHVAGEIHRAERVGIVMDIGRVQPRFAAVLASPGSAWGRSGGRPCGRNCNAPSTR